MHDQDFPTLDHDQALDLARQYAKEHGKPFVVGSAGLGFGPVAEEDLPEMRATFDSFAAATQRPPTLVTTYRVRPDGQLEAA
jgi:hypothetical protein